VYDGIAAADVPWQSQLLLLPLLLLLLCCHLQRASAGR
jgi:hypothetical protein